MKKAALLLVLLVSSTVFCSEMDELFTFLAQNKLFNGVVVAARGEKVIFHKAFGCANVEWGIANTLDARFEIGSVTKQFTAMLVLQLKEEGKIALDDPVGKYVPEIASQFKNITLHQLLTHTSGLPSPSDVLPDYYKVHIKVGNSFAERLEQIKDGELQFPPGTSWAYCGFGYTVLGEIVARVTGRSLEDNYKQRIFTPMGLQESGVYYDGVLVPKRAYGYQKRWDESYVPPVYFAQSRGMLGGGGLYSTAGDLLKWLKGVHGVAQGIREPFFKVHHRFADGSGYCYGNFYEKYALAGDKQVSVYFHGGSLPGTSALVMSVPELDTRIVLLHNGGMGRESFLHEVAVQMLHILRGKPWEKPKVNLWEALVYPAFFHDMTEVRRAYRHLQTHRPDVYVFGTEQLLTLAAILQGFGRGDRAGDILRFNAGEYPGSFAGWLALGKYYLDQGKQKVALPELRKALELADGEQKEAVRELLKQIADEEK